MPNLADKVCVPCGGDAKPLRGAELEKLRDQVPGWGLVEEHHLRRNFRFENFRAALGFVNRVGELAEEQGHHPDIDFGWGRAEVNVFTHTVDGLTENDFIFAAKVDLL
ncbi:MAG: 4a-hydroxytetrahydrobiopterin dehydratase [Rubrobacteraceae bacterium]